MLFWDLILRLIVAACLGALIGLDRTYRAKEAGLRTHFLVCLGSALFMIVSQYGFEDLIGTPGIQSDPGRIAAQVVSGIGFLGAGTIMIQKQFVRGLTTAAGLWATAAIGLVIGGGMYYIGIAGVILILAGLELTHFFLPGVGLHSVLLVFSTEKKENLETITAYLNKQGHHITNYNTEEEHYGDTKVYHISMIIKIRKISEQNVIFQFIQSLPNLTVNKME
ncbi:MgtC/SapB family protein [Odoribacter lunatus]|uniref:MgtC/SapB family protein n=1 Tax=Odoribacter lunatus TaxID=2941335 RepID=UPI002040ECCD|nr:MgtC/SapB family protein [Odoribacter lunatus]